VSWFLALAEKTSNPWKAVEVNVMAMVEVIFDEEHNDGCNHQSQSVFSMSTSLHSREKCLQIH